MLRSRLESDGPSWVRLTSESSLITDETDNVQGRSTLPSVVSSDSDMDSGSLFRLHHPEPSQADSPSEHGESGSDVRPPHSVIRQRSHGQEQYGLNRKRKSIGDEDNRVD